MNNEQAIIARLEELKDWVERIDKRQEATQDTVGDIRVAVAGLKVKAGVWGAVAGLLPALAALFWVLLK